MRMPPERVFVKDFIGVNIMVTLYTAFVNNIVNT